MHFEFDEKPTAIITAAIGVIYFSWLCFGRKPKMRIARKNEFGAVRFDVVVLNPGGQPFTVSCVVAKRWELFTHPLAHVLGSNYELWPCGKKKDIGVTLVPGEQKKFTVFVSDDKMDTLKIKIKRTSSWSEPRVYDLVVF